MDTKWKKSRSIIGFLAFLLGVSLLLEGALFFGTKLTSSGSRRWISDSFASDWRDTTEFRGFVSSRLERLITMGAGAGLTAVSTITVTTTGATGTAQRRPLARSGGPKEPMNG